MFTSLKSFIYNFGHNPLRGVLILITITVGVATLSVTGGMSADINNALSKTLAETGRRVSIINGTVDNQGEIVWQKPGKFTPAVFDALESDYPNLSDLSYVSDAWVKPIAFLDNKTYEMRSAIQTNETFAKLMDLEIVEGSFFSETDVANRRDVVVISDLAGQMIYGSAADALGRKFTVATREGMLPYTIIGLYKNVSDFERETYGIGDFIFPEAAGIPQGIAIHPIQRGGILLGRIAIDSIEKAESRIRSILAPMYGSDVEVTLWEGLPGGAAAVIEEGRDSVRNFATAVNILGFIILATSSIGIFSVMLVEVLNRTRDIGLRRALGTTKTGIRLFFIGQALYYSTFGSVIGVLLSLVLYRPVGTFLSPLFDSAGFSVQDVSLSVPGAGPIAIAVGAALIFGALFGFFPAISASNTPIIECIREDAA